MDLKFELMEINIPSLRKNTFNILEEYSDELNSVSSGNEKEKQFWI